MNRPHMSPDHETLLEFAGLHGDIPKVVAGISQKRETHYSMDLIWETSRLMLQSQNEATIGGRLSPERRLRVVTKQAHSFHSRLDHSRVEYFALDSLTINRRIPHLDPTRK